MRCVDVLRLADPFGKEKKKKIICSASFFFTLFWRVRPQGGSFPQRRVWDGGTRGQDRRSERKKERMGKKKKAAEITLPSPFPLESITQTPLLMLKRRCLEYYCSSSYLMMWNHLKLTVFSVFGG